MALLGTMRILVFFILTLFLASPQLRAENSKSSQKPGGSKATQPAEAPALEESKTETRSKMSGASLPPLKSYPPRGEAWELPVELDKSVRVAKVYDFLNDRGITPSGRKSNTEEEFKYYEYGAVTAAQIQSRKGHYYTVNFENEGAPADLILRMDYRQTLSRDKVTTLEIPYKGLNGSAKGRFSITGDAYKTYGDVNSWRISVVRNGKIVAQARSFVW
jgi:hypothetical protein